MAYQIQSTVATHHLLSETQTYLPTYTELRFLEKIRILSEKSSYVWSNYYVFGIIGKLLKNAREWCLVDVDILKTV